MPEMKDHAWLQTGLLLTCGYSPVRNPSFKTRIFLFYLFTTNVQPPANKPA